MHAFLASYKSQKALSTDQVLFSYYPIMLHNKLSQNSVACNNKHIFSCLWVYGWLGFSRSRRAGFQAEVWVWVSSVHLPDYCNQQATCPAFLSRWWKITERQSQARWTSTHQPLLGSHLLASHQPKLVTRPNKVAKGMGFGFVSTQHLLLTCVPLGKSLTLLWASVSYSEKWDNESYIPGSL